MLEYITLYFFIDYCMYFIHNNNIPMINKLYTYIIPIYDNNKK